MSFPYVLCSQNIDAMLVLEACGSLVLYTGITRVRGHIYGHFLFSNQEVMSLNFCPAVLPG